MPKKEIIKEQNLLVYLDNMFAGKLDKNDIQVLKNTTKQIKKDFQDMFHKERLKLINQIEKKDCIISELKEKIKTFSKTQALKKSQHKYKFCWQPKVIPKRRKK